MRRKRGYFTRVLLFDDGMYDGKLGLVFDKVTHPLSQLRPELSPVCAVSMIEPNSLAAKSFPTWAASEPVSLRRPEPDATQWIDETKPLPPLLPGDWIVVAVNGLHKSFNAIHI